jgi:selenocysteine lyase/cysteine desulfurase
MTKLLSLDFSNDFSSFEDKIWLNAASEGPIPKVSVDALHEAIRWKSLPYLLTHEKFVFAHKGLKESLGKLLNVSARDMIVATSASYGLHLLANGLPWKKGDEIIVMQNDFPTDILPWLYLEKRGVKVRQLKAKNKVLTLEELKSAINSKTKLFCISQVHTFTGIPVDMEAMGEMCRKNKIFFVVNLSQSAGNVSIDLASYPIDAVVGAGYKWLLGPYSTGFAWIKPSLREQLDVNNTYWSAVLSEEELKNEGALTLKDNKTARRLDMFAPANFFNFIPWKASIDYLLKIGIDQVYEYNQTLIDALINHLDLKSYVLISPPGKTERSNLVVISHREKQNNLKIYKGVLLEGIYPAFWKGNIRFSPHLYNTPAQMQKVSQILRKFS